MKTPKIEQKNENQKTRARKRHKFLIKSRAEAGARLCLYILTQLHYNANSKRLS